MKCGEALFAFEVSLLLESVGLTMDKVMRCAAGIHEAGRSVVWGGMGRSSVMMACVTPGLLRCATFTYTCIMHGMLWGEVWGLSLIHWYICIYIYYVYIKIHNLSTIYCLLST